MLRVLRLVLFAGLLLALAACVDRSDPARVVVLAFDGLEPAVVDELMAVGELPALAQMRQNGAYGRLTADGKLGGRQLWRTVSAAERTVAVVGWPGSWPAEEVNGALVSERLCAPWRLPDDWSAEAPHLAWPKQLHSELAGAYRCPAGLDLQAMGIRDEEVELRRAVGSAETSHGVGLKLWREQRPDLAMVHSVELRLVLERRPELAESVCRLADRMVGEWLDEIDRPTALVVAGLPVAPDGGEAAVSGVLYLFGHRVARNARLEQPRPEDVARTVLALGDVKVGAGHPGRVLAEGLRLPGGGSNPPPAVAPQAAAPVTVDRDQALALCEQARRAVEGGEVRAALEILDRAEQADPGLALVWQYRSNVAYMAGDGAAAIRALERGLELEPENRLFRSNLESLRRQQAGGGQ